VFLIAAITLLLSLTMLDQLELLTSMVSFGALLGFLLLHVSVVAHFVWRNGSRDWLRHLLVPAIGFAITAYVLWNAEANAKIAGGRWMLAGLVLFVMLRLLHRRATMPTP
jgi:amino acid transporter